MPSPLALAMMQQQPITTPPPVTVQATDVAAIYKNAQDAALRAYQEQLAQRNSMWGPLASLGGAAIRAFGAPIVGKLFPPNAQAGNDDYAGY